MSLSLKSETVHVRLTGAAVQDASRQARVYLSRPVEVQAHVTPVRGGIAGVC